MSRPPINPFYAARTVRNRRRSGAEPNTGPDRRSEADPKRVVWTAESPGELIRELIRLYRPDRVFDPMEGAGACKAVCRELGVSCISADLRYGVDASSAASYPRATRFPLVWLDPPSWRRRVYTTDVRDLSRQPSLEAFLEQYGRVIDHCAGVLEPGGKLAVLVGDYTDREAGHVPLVAWTARLARMAGLRPHATFAVRSGSSGAVDICRVFEKPPQ